MGAAYPAWLVDTGIIWPLFATALGVVAWVGRREYRRFKAEQAAQFQELIEQLRPIQPDANGGLSLPDVIKTVNQIRDRQSLMGDALEGIRSDLADHKSEHRWRSS